MIHSARPRIPRILPRSSMLVLLLLLSALAMPGCRRKRQQAATAPAASVWTVQFGDPGQAKHLLRGVYPGNEAWRWTQRVAAVALDRPPWTASTYIDIDFTVPMEIADEYPSTTVLVRVNGVEACRQTYARTGRYRLFCHVPEPALNRFPAEVEIESDKSIRDPDTGAEKSLIVISAGFNEFEASEEYRQQQAERARAGYQTVLDAYKKQLPPETIRQWQALFHKLPVWESVYFQGVQTLKNPLDLWMLQETMWEVKPELIIETGTWKGGSAIYMAAVAEQLDLPTRIFTVDLLNVHQSAETHRQWRERVDFVQGSSTDKAVVEKAAAAAKGKRTLVTLDSAHNTRHVLNELRAYAPLVTSGSYIIVEDTHMDGVPTYPGQGPGPMAAVRQFLEEGGSRDFEVDHTREAFIMTFNPGGWLRRK